MWSVACQTDSCCGRPGWLSGIMEMASAASDCTAIRRKRGNDWTRGWILDSVRSRKLNVEEREPEWLHVHVCILRPCFWRNVPKPKHRHSHNIHSNRELTTYAIHGSPNVSILPEQFQKQSTGRFLFQAAVAECGLKVRLTYRESGRLFMLHDNACFYGYISATDLWRIARRALLLRR